MFAPHSVKNPDGIPKCSLASWQRAANPAWIKEWKGSAWRWTESLDSLYYSVVFTVARGIGISANDEET
jgi:hypothetical protein